MLLSPQEWILIAIIAITLVLIISNLLRPDLVAILVLATLPLTGLVTYQEAFSGFSRSVVITIIGLFIITQALEDVGVVLLPRVYRGKVMHRREEVRFD